MTDNIKNKVTVWITPESCDMVSAFYSLDNCPTKSIFVERAIRYYSGHVSSGKSTDYLPDEVSKSVKRAFTEFETHISKMLFRFSVELDMLMNVVAASINVDASELSKLRAQCVENVKHTRGQIIFDKAVKYQNGDDDE